MIEFRLKKPDDGNVYKQRIGVYGFIENNSGEIAVIKTAKGIFLPGGGLEEGEDELECLQRECIEEAGMLIEIGNKFAIGSAYFITIPENKPMENRGNYYRCTFTSFTNGKVEDDHELIWFNPIDIRGKLWLENQREALEIYIKKIIKINR